MPSESDDELPRDKWVHAPSLPPLPLSTLHPHQQPQQQLLQQQQQQQQEQEQQEQQSQTRHRRAHTANTSISTILLERATEGSLSFFFTILSLLLSGAALYLTMLAMRGPSPPSIPASFGATSVLFYSAPGAQSPMSQIYPALLGQAIGAVVGVTVAWAQEAFGFPLLPCVAIAVAAAIAFMTLAGALHPPAGATSALAVLSENSLKDLGYMLVVDVVLGTAVLLFTSFAMCKIMRKYGAWQGASPPLFLSVQEDLEGEVVDPSMANDMAMDEDVDEELDIEKLPG